MPSLTLLPNCPKPLEEWEEADVSGEVIDPDDLDRMIHFPDLDCVGILSNDNEDSIVASLSVIRATYLCIQSSSEYDVAVAQIWLYNSSKSKWELHELPICCEEKHRDDLFRWSTNRVVAFGAYLCWVDYRCGILFCEVFNESLQISYARLPVDVICHTKAYMDMFRTICVVKDGGGYKMKFVDVNHCGGYVPYPCSDDFEVTFWTLIVEDGKMDWKRVFSITDNNLPMSVPSPHEPLTYPFLSLDNRDVAYFFVAELGCLVKKVWLVSVDLDSKTVKHALPYLNGKEDLSGDDADWAIGKRHCLEPLLLSEITCYFLQKTTRDRNASRDSQRWLQIEDEWPLLMSKASIKGSSSLLSQRSSDVLYEISGGNIGSLHSDASTEDSHKIVRKIDCPKSVTGEVRSEVCQQFSFRLLCPNVLIEDVIGWRGWMIRHIEDEVGVCVDIADCVSRCMERVITISASESPKQCSAVQSASLRIFDRMARIGRNICPLFSEPSQTTARVLLSDSQLGC